MAAVTAYFARRSADPQTVADLTADTFVQAITSFATFDPRKGTSRAWVFGIARRIYAAHCQAHSQQRSRVERLAGLQAKEAAQVLGVAPGTLRIRLMRARARLRKTAGPDLAHGIDTSSEPEAKT